MLGKILKKLTQILGINFIIGSIQRKRILPSAVLLVLVNLIPIFGVIFWNWNAFDIIVLYWIENIVIGVCNIPRIIMAQVPVYGTNYLNSKEGYTIANLFLNLFLAGFFTMHFGIFTVVHGVFVNMIALNRSSFLISNDYSGIGAFFLALLISHGFSLIYNYILRGEYEQTSATQQMGAPYPRIFVLQLTLILGGFLSFFSSRYLIVIFVLIKILFDLGFHLKSHLNKNNNETLKAENSINLNS